MKKRAYNICNGRKYADTVFTSWDRACRALAEEVYLELREREHWYKKGDLLPLEEKTDVYMCVMELDEKG